MKKIVYILLFASVLTLSLSSCTEESVEPTALDGGGGASADSKN